jgi:hypothetical protein
MKLNLLGMDGMWGFYEFEEGHTMLKVKNHQCKTMSVLICGPSEL